VTAFLTAFKWKKLCSIIFRVWGTLKQWQWVSHFILWCYHNAFHKKDHNKSASIFTQKTMWIRSALFWDISQCTAVIPYWSFRTT
jgi:hypothetical protein